MREVELVRFETLKRSSMRGPGLWGDTLVAFCVDSTYAINVAAGKWR